MDTARARILGDGTGGYFEAGAGVRTVMGWISILRLPISGKDAACGWSGACGGQRGRGGRGVCRGQEGEDEERQRTLGRSGHMDGQATANAVPGAPPPSMPLPVTQLQPRTHAVNPQQPPAIPSAPSFPRQQPPPSQARRRPASGGRAPCPSDVARRVLRVRRSLRTLACPAISHQIFSSAAAAIHTAVQRASSNSLLLPCDLVC